LTHDKGLASADIPRANNEMCFDSAFLAFSWIGAWWLGPLIISVLLFIFGPWLVLFPGKLVVPSSDGDAIKDEDPEPETAKEWLQEFVTVTKRLTSNKIYVLNTVSTVVLLFGLVGFFQFFTKYMEFQFYQNASKAGGIGGIANIAVTVFGIILSGFVMSKYKFTARQVTGYGCFVSLIG
jgi:organic anion transporter 5A